MKLFSISGLKCVDQHIIEHKLGDMIEAALQEDSIEGDERPSIEVQISGREDNIFEMNAIYSVSIMSEVEHLEDDETAQYKVISLSTDVDRKGEYNLSLKRRNHPDDENDKRYEEINVSGLPASAELLTIKAGDLISFEIRAVRD